MQAARAAHLHTRELFAEDPARFDRFSAEGAGLLLDFSRQRVDARALGALVSLADACDLRSAIRAMYRGDRINLTEGRAVLHVALRQPDDGRVGGEAIAREVLAERERMLDFAQAVREGRVVGHDGRPFRTVVNIGIGGSDLGPAMAVEALAPWQGAAAPRVAFVSNVDGCTLADVLRAADPATTLFIVASKTFTTQETMANAHAARGWLLDRLGPEAVPAHFAAVSTNAAAMDAFGINRAFRFTMWDWVGGRYSLWSSIGVSIAVAIGADNFRALLAGGHEMDLHFATADWGTNLPVLMALLGIWNVNFLRLPTLAVLPYDSRLGRFPAFLQQLEMESNGKRVDAAGGPLDRETAPIVWGEPGNNAQHSFFQLLHQGTPRAALDMILAAHSSCDRSGQHQLAIANCLAQAEAFAHGQQGPGVPSHKEHEGNRPVSLLMLGRLDPAGLGRLVALYEHKVFVQSVLWGINAFDQWGVELGKKLADGVLRQVRGDPGAPPVPASLDGTLRALRRLATR
jgi:glucose-6-phosphate isomerase